MGQGTEESEARDTGALLPAPLAPADGPTSRRPERPRPSTRWVGSDRLRRGSRWVARGLLILAVITAVLWQGGVSVESVVTTAALTALAWLCALPAYPHKAPRSRLGLLWLAMGAWTALQLVPLPHAVVALLQPRTVAIVDAGRTALGLPVAGWLPLALAPGDAALQGALYLVAGSLSLLAGLVLMGENSRPVARAGTLVVLGLACVSGLAWACAWLAPVAELLPPSLSALLRNLAFVNPNNETGLLNLGVALALGRVAQGGSSRQQTLFGLVATGLALLVLMAGSRGGYLTLVAVLGLTVALLPRPPRYLRRDERDRQMTALRSVGSVALVLLVLAALLALPIIERELRPTTLHDEKLKLMRHMLSLVGTGWTTGSGPGSLPVLAGLDAHFGSYRYDFAENLLIERALDQGILFSVAFVAALAWLMRGMLRRAADRSQAPGMIVAIAAMLMANLVDFSLELAGGLAPMLLVAACAERLLPTPTSDRQGRSGPRAGYRRVMLSTGVALAVAAMLLAVAVPGVTRHAPEALAGQKPAAARDQVARHFVHDQHAFYLLGRTLIDHGDLKGGLRALDRAVALRPDSKHAHLFRFAARVEAGDVPGATADLRWLLHADPDTFERTLQLCARSSRAEAALVAAIPDLTDVSYVIGMHYERSRPDLLERLALALREKFPDKRYGIEAVRGHLYVKRGKLEPARQIATALLLDPATRDQGWLLEALIQAHTNHPLDAFHLFADLCDRHPKEFEPCLGAMEAAMQAREPRILLRFLERHRDVMMESPARASAYWHAFATAKMLMNEFDEGMQAARTAHGLAPDELPTALLLAHALGQVGQHEEERELVGRLKEKYPHDERVLALWKQVEVDLSPLAGLVEHAPAAKPVTPTVRAP